LRQRIRVDDAQVPLWQPIGSQIGTQSITPVRFDQ